MTTPVKSTVGVLLAVGIFAAGYMANRHPVPVASSASARQVLYYTCPMHPHYKSDHPGDAPCCGMRLVPVYSGEAGSVPDPVTPGVPGIVQIGAARQQLIGVLTDEVRSAPVSHPLRLSGRVTVDDNRLCRIMAAVDGWIRELGRNTAGSFVKKDQVLASYYTNNLLASQQTLVYNVAVNEQTPQGGIGFQRQPTSLSLQVAVDSLRSLGMSDNQIEELKRTRQTAADVLVYSPISGFVIARSISPGQRFDKGTEMYRIADISHVWVMTDLFEKDREFVRPGAVATVRYQNREFPARMSDALPQLDPQSRTLKTRFDVENAGYVLRPDAFVDVEMNVKMPSAITVPADAVIDSGRRKSVYVDRGNGFFEPREVETGWRLGGRVQITRGLETGERIAVSGNFLIDSESRMNAASAGASAVQMKMAAAEKPAGEKDPVCGMDADPKAASAIKAQYGGKTYTFCSEHCKKTFEANPGKYVTKKMAAGDVSRGPA